MVARHLVTLCVLAVVAASLFTACQTQAGASGTDALTIAAASDLQLAFGEIGERFQRERGYRAVFTFGSTGTLAKQIENGAPVDVFAAANVQFVDDLIGKGKLVADSRRVYGAGRIVVASLKQSWPPVRGLADLVRPEIKKVAIANPEHAPYGMAAREALEAAGLLEQVRPKLIYGENVRQALQYVQTGNTEAGIIALAIAGAPDVTYSIVDEHLHQPLRQVMAIVASTRREPAAREFIAFVASPAGRDVLAKYGFAPLDGP